LTVAGNAKQFADCVRVDFHFVAVNQSVEDEASVRKVLPLFFDGWQQVVCLSKL